METVGEMRTGDVQQDGFSILPGVLVRNEIQALLDAVSKIDRGEGVRSRGSVYGVRNLLHLAPEMNELASGVKVRSIIEEHLGKNAFSVRATLFDKTDGANWLVPWHQDLTVCVMARIDVPGYGPWTVKAGVCHVQPPVSILDNMLSVRIHLDDCDESNGALRVLPGTHKLGRLTPERIAEQQRSMPAVTCAVRAGDIVLMKPLLLHASGVASRAVHRRVIHIDYATSQLDGGLRWSTTQASLSTERESVRPKIEQSMKGTD